MLLEVEHATDVVVEAFVVEDERDLVERVGVDRGDDPLLGDVAELADLLLQPGRDRPVRAADDHVGLDAPAAQLGDRVLGRLGLLLARRADERHQGHVDVEDVLPADVLAELPDRLEERQDLDVADRAADLGDHDVDVLRGEREDPVLDLVGDVRDDLHRLAEVRAVPLLGEHRLVDRSGGRVALAVERHVDEALVVTEVEVGLAAVVGDEHLAVLEGVHRAGIDVDVGVELLQRDPQAPALEQPPERRSREALAQARRHPTGHEDVLRQPHASALPIVGTTRNTARFSREVDGTMRAPVHRPSWSTVITVRRRGRRWRREPWTAGPAGSTSRCSRSARSCCGSRRTSRRRTSATTTAGTASPRSRCARATTPFRDIFSSQGPLFLPLVHARRPRRVRDAWTRRGCSRWPRARSPPSRSTSPGAS